MKIIYHWNWSIHRKILITNLMFWHLYVVHVNTFHCCDPPAWWCLCFPVWELWWCLISPDLQPLMLCWRWDNKEIPESFIASQGYYNILACLWKTLMYWKKLYVLPYRSFVKIPTYALKNLQHNPKHFHHLRIHAFILTQIIQENQPLLRKGCGLVNLVKYGTLRWFGYLTRISLLGLKGMFGFSVRGW